MKKYIIPLIFLLIAGTVKSQTTTPMAQYASNQLIYNPAFAGAHDLFSVNLSLKKLWIGMPNSPQLIGLNMHAPFVNQRNSLGFIFQRETLGPQAINLVNLTYAYKFRIGESGFLSLGIQGGLFNTLTDWSKIDHLLHPEDPFYGGEDRWVTNRFDMGAGAYFQTNDFYIGISARHLTTPKFDEIQFDDEKFHSLIRRQFFLMGGYNIVLNSYLNLRPRMLMRYKQNEPFTVSTGVDLAYLNRFSLGVNFMTGLPTLTLAATVEIFEGLRVGYAFDMNFGDIGPFQRGSHEFFISYYMPIWNKVSDSEINEHFR